MWVFVTARVGRRRTLAVLLAWQQLRRLPVLPAPCRESLTEPRVGGPYIQLNVLNVNQRTYKPNGLLMNNQIKPLPVSIRTQVLKYPACISSTSLF